MNIDISIIIPVYNMENYINQCLDSVFNQTHKNIEVIIINDGSIDNSENIINEYKDKYKNIVYINQENQGLSASRNAGIKEAKGQYIMFLDSDDYIEKNCTEILYNQAIKTNSDVVIMGHKKVYDKDSAKLNEEIKYEQYKDKIYKGKEIANLMINLKIGGYACDKLIKRENLEYNPLQFEKDRYIEDFYPIFKHIYNCEKVTFVNQILYNYRQRESSISNSINIKLINDYVNATTNIIKYIDQEKYFKSDDIITFKYNSFRTVINLLNRYYKKSHKIYKEFKKEKYKIYKINILKIYKCKQLSKLSKIDKILWELKIYNLLMPELINLKKTLKI
jgi:glycosyltransferase involved in cell wall biosynthesis